MFSKMQILVDLHDAIQSKSRFRLKPSDVTIPRELDVTVVEIVEPDYVDVDIDRLVVKRLPIRSQLQVHAADGYVVLGSVATSPDSATVRGPRRFVERVDTLLSQTLTVERAKRRVHKELPLIRPEGIHVTLRPTQVVAEIDVQRLKKRVIQDIPVVLMHTPFNRTVSLDSSTITLTVEGGEEFVASLTSEDFQVSVDYRQADRGSTDAIPPVILTPPDVTLTDAKPRTFRIVESGS